MTMSISVQDKTGYADSRGAIKQKSHKKTQTLCIVSPSIPVPGANKTNRFKTFQAGHLPCLFHIANDTLSLAALTHDFLMRHL